MQNKRSLHGAQQQPMACHGCRLHPRMVWHTLCLQTILHQMQSATCRMMHAASHEHVIHTPARRQRGCPAVGRTCATMPPQGPPRVLHLSSRCPQPPQATQHPAQPHLIEEGATQNSCLPPLGSDVRHICWSGLCTHLHNLLNLGTANNPAPLLLNRV